ncbi:MAG: transcription termination/antitermination protein NusG [Thermoguttaceae bacterium]
MTEQTGPNPEVLQDLPARQAGVDPQPDIAPVLPEHDRDVSTVVEGTVAEAAVSPPVCAEVHPEESQPEANPEVAEHVTEAASPDPVVEVASPEPVKRAKTAAAARPPKARKAAAAVPAVVADVPKSENMNWYILKVQSNREESIREGLLRRVSIQGLDRYFGEVIVPTEKVTEFKGGKKRVIKRKLYPGYIVVHMEINEDTWFLVRETPGIGDFTGASGVPTPMLPHEVERIIAKQEEKSEKAPDLKIPFAKGDRVKVIEGNFENFEGEVDAIDKTNGRVTVMITIFNRTTPVEFEYWQVESV